VAALVIGAAVIAIGGSQASAAATCGIDYDIVNEWSDGFQGSIEITNNGPAISSWTLEFDFGNGESVQHGWGGQYSQSGATVTVANESWNGSIGSGQSVTTGFIGAQSGGAVVPDSFQLNGEICDTADGSTTTTTDGSTTSTTDGSTTSTTEGSTTSTTEGSTTTSTSIQPGEYEPRQANPYDGLAGWYVNPLWSERATASGGGAVADQPTAVWLDTIGAIEGDPDSVSGGAWGLETHLDEALEQQAAAGGGPFVFQFVTYNLPARDCAALASNGELGIDELDRYQSEYIDEIDAILSRPEYASLRIVSVIEIDSLPNLVTNVDGEPGATALCTQVRDSGVYVDGIRYAIDAYADNPNVYSYIDAAHHGWIGWDDNRSATASLLADTVLGSQSNGSGVAGFIANTANYSALVEPSIPYPLSQEARQSSWIDWNMFADELTFAQAFRQDLINAGLPSDIGFLIDTSRNGWGGTNRPDGSGSTIDEVRIDRRIHAGNWCNQSGAGLGERPQASPESGIDAYVWIKPPGESDGSSELIPTGPDNPDGKGFDEMCDPTYTGNARNGYSMTGALPNAPVSGAWFEAQFQELVANAYPPLD
jgi:cellulose 1,4-beta-cellobiosidase